MRGRASGQEDSEEFDDYVMTANPLPLPPKPAALPKGRVVPLDRLQDSSVLHEKLPDNLVPTSQSNVFIRERSDLNINIDKSAIQNSNLNHLHSKETSSTAVYNNISIGKCKLAEHIAYLEYFQALIKSAAMANGTYVQLYIIM